MPNGDPQQPQHPLTQALLGYLGYLGGPGMGQILPSLLQFMRGGGNQTSDQTKYDWTWRYYPSPSVWLDPPPGWPESTAPEGMPPPNLRAKMSYPADNTIYMNPPMSSTGAGVGLDPNATLEQRLAQAKKERDLFDQYLPGTIAEKQQYLIHHRGNPNDPIGPIFEDPPLGPSGSSNADEFYHRALRDLAIQADQQYSTPFTKRQRFLRSLSPTASQLQHSDLDQLQQQINVLQGKFRS